MNAKRFTSCVPIHPSSLIPHPLRRRGVFSQNRGSGTLHRSQNLLIDVVGQLRLQRRRRGAIDDLGDLRRVMGSERKALARATNLAESGDELFFEQVGEHAADEIALQILVIDVHSIGPYVTVTDRPRAFTFGSLPRPRRTLAYADSNTPARSSLSHCVSAITVI